MQFRTEKKIKRFLTSLSDDQIKKLFEDFDVSPFPLLIMLEHERRFGKKNKKIVSMTTSQLRNIHEKQNKLLREIKIELKKLEQLTISISGLEKISKTSIEDIQLRRAKNAHRITKLVGDLEKLNRRISLKENDLVNMKGKNQK
ncbi:MAG TPA: hypothetical protein VFM64_01690 [Candidatus Nitrosotenuis sp.]|nr:hypothetical protein [Candidatus Nitrosotenuis sp.]